MVDNEILSHVLNEAERVVRGEIAPQVSDLTRQRFREAIDRARDRERRNVVRIVKSGGVP